MKWRSILTTGNDRTLTLLRLVLGAVFFAHGAQKMLGWFGGYGFRGTMGYFTRAQHIPAPFAFLAIVAEFLGALGLLSGLLGRVAAAGISATMLTAVALVHLPNGFFMNWSGAQKGEGFEYHLLVLGMAAVVMIKGSGAWSLDRLIAGRGEKPPAVAASPLRRSA